MHYLLLSASTFTSTLSDSAALYNSEVRFIPTPIPPKRIPTPSMRADPLDVAPPCLSIHDAGRGTHDRAASLLLPPVAHPRSFANLEKVCTINGLCITKGL